MVMGGVIRMHNIYPWVKLIHIPNRESDPTCLRNADLDPRSYFFFTI